MYSLTCYSMKQVQMYKSDILQREAGTNVQSDMLQREAGTNVQV